MLTKNYSSTTLWGKMKVVFEKACESTMLVFC